MCEQIAIRNTRRGSNGEPIVTQCHIFSGKIWGRIAEVRGSSSSFTGIHMYVAVLTFIKQYGICLAAIARQTKPVKRHSCVHTVAHSYV